MRPQVDGGRWILEDEAYIDVVDIQDGQVVVEGSIQGSEVNLYGGVLSGIGEVQSEVHNIAGTVSPGNSIGVLTIDGSYIQHAGAELLIEIRDSADPQAGVDYDQLAVTDTAFFKDGTTVRFRRWRRGGCRP